MRPRSLMIDSSQKLSAPTPIPDTRLAAPNCRKRRGTAAAAQAACTSGYMPDRQAGGSL